MHIANSGWAAAVAVALFPETTFASADTNGPNGINSADLGLSGDSVAIGQVEFYRPGDPDIDDDGTPFEAGTDDDGSHSNFGTDPKAVFIENGIAPSPNSSAQIIDDPGPPPSAHATEVAGVMISTDPLAPGVAPGADLYASAGDQPTTVVDLFDKLALSAQHVAVQNGGDVRAINFSFGVPFEPGDAFDGNSQLTQFVDWSSSAHDVLYVQGGFEMGVPTGAAQPTDNFNGIKVGASEKPMNESVYRQVSDLNIFNQHPDSNRTLIDIIAPGEEIEVAAIGAPFPAAVRPGTSYAAPHVAGTVALLQEHADNNYDPLDPQWSENARRHEVMKAVMMNSADKIEEGTAPPPGALPIPPGGLLGMERTVLKQDGVSTWFDSAAYGDGFGEQGGFVPLDEEMGAGHLNASRALTQFAPGEWPSDSDDVPLIGWDWGTTTGINPVTEQGDINRYRFEEPLLGSSFVSITLAWDRQVEFAVDNGTMNHFDEDDSFEDYTQDPFQPQADSVINNMVLWLLPGNASTTDDAIAMSDFNEGTVQHIFFQIPEDGEYQFWVEQFDEEEETIQDYAVAWWAKAVPSDSPGDFDGDDDVDDDDFDEFKSNFGTGSGADADNDGDSEGADFLAWQQDYGTGVPAVAAHAPVPEPAPWVLAAVALPLSIKRRVAA
jgi:hypothetical protein